MIVFNAIMKKNSPETTGEQTSFVELALINKKLLEEL
jgi:hypothetical protein